MTRSDVIIVGAGPAGLACAASIKAVGLHATVLEKSGTVGSVWRRHYDRLHLHNDRAHSGLPGMPMPRTYPKYPSRAQVVSYFEAYAERFRIEPMFGSEVAAIRRDGDMWCADGCVPMSAPVVIVATGIASAPYRPSWPDIAAFDGDIVHSADYRNPSAYAGKRVLVVGYGNSGGEIALDLAEAGVATTLAVRGPVQILPRDLLGFPILSWAILYQHLPARLVDTMNAPVLRLVLGSVDQLGLKLGTKGPRQMIEEDQRVPLIDIGTLAKIRDGSIKIRGSIARFSTPDGVTFADGAQDRFDALILATGFRPDLRRLMPETNGVFDEHGMPLTTGRVTNEPGLFFCGQIPSATGQLREIGIEAQRIAVLAKRYVASVGHRQT